MRKLALGVVLFGLVAAPACAARLRHRLRAAEPGRAAEVPLVVAERAGRQRRDRARDRSDGRRGLRRRRDRRRAPLSSTGLDPAGHGWGTQAWVDATQTALERAKARGMTIDLTAGPAGPPPSRRSRPTAPPRSRSSPTAACAHRPPTAARRRSRWSRPRRRRHAASSSLYVQAAKVTTAGNPPTHRLHARQEHAPDAHAGRRRTSPSRRPTAATGS